jgi:hypothetical protein
MSVAFVREESAAAAQEVRSASVIVNRKHRLIHQWPGTAAGRLK